MDGTPPAALVGYIDLDHFLADCDLSVADA
jgi:hypothetical protein